MKKILFVLAAVVIEDFKGNLLKKHFIVNGKEISFENWMEPYQMSFYYNNQTKINYLLKDGEKIERKEKFYKEIKFPICEDETIGVVEFYINNDKIHKKEIKSDSEVKKWNICDIIHLTLKEFY